MKLYIAGPMSGLPDLNFPAFFAAAAQLRALGHSVVNPAEIDQGKNPTWVSCMRKDIPRLIQCDAVVLLPGWATSRGAGLELHIANALDMPTYALADALRELRAVPA